MIELIPECLIAVVIVFLQINFFRKTLGRIGDVASFFPFITWNESYISSGEYKGNPIQLLKEEDFRGEFLQLLQSVNKYLEKNRGATDFNIIKSIIERRIENLENEVTAVISLPLYTGLMGTFLGIIAGLLTVVIDGGINDNSISGFLGGVVIAMGASFVGLLLTVRNNSHHFKNAKSDCDHRKLLFYDFLQQDLIPHMGNSLYEALDSLTNNINTFNTTFKENIELFDGKFAGNIKSLKESVGTLSENMGDLVENTKTQQSLLMELRKLGQLNIARVNTQMFKLLTDLVPHLLTLQENQKQLNETVEQASSSAASIERIMNRLKSFEESLLNLGPVLDNRQFLGNEILVRVDKSLKHLDGQYNTLKDHGSDTMDSINKHFDSQSQKIKVLTEKIKEEIEEALNFDVGNNPLKKLLLMDSLDNHLNDISHKLDAAASTEKSLHADLVGLKTQVQRQNDLFVSRRQDNSPRSPISKKPRKKRQWYKFWQKGDE